MIMVLCRSDVALHTSVDGSCTAHVSDTAGGAGDPEACRDPCPTCCVDPSSIATSQTLPATLMFETGPDLHQLFAFCAAHAHCNSPPVAACKPAGAVSVLANENCQAAASPAGIDDGSCDAKGCGNGAPLTLSVSPEGPFMPNSTPAPMKLTAKGSRGLTDECETSMTIVDKTALAFLSCPEDPHLITDASCMANLPANGLSMTVADNCDGGWQAPHGTSGLLEGHGSHNITFSASDASGNEAELTCQVTTVDEMAPMLACPAECALALDDSCRAEAPEDHVVMATNNCNENLVITHNVTSALEGCGLHNITFSSHDSSGNEAGELACQVTTVDEMEPTVSCPSGVDTVATAGRIGGLPASFEASAMDNCDENLAVTRNGTTLVGLGEHIIGFTTSDASGNEASCCTTANLIDPDGDGYCGIDDHCLGTVNGDSVTVDTHGCSVEQHCPCEGNWKKHKEHLDCVSCVLMADQFSHSGLILTEEETDAIIVEACENDCGSKEGEDKKTDKDKCSKLKFDCKSKSKDESARLVQDHATGVRHRWLRGPLD